MTFSLYTHDAWGAVPVGEFASLEEAKTAFSALCEDPWYAADGTFTGIELVETDPTGEQRRLDWFGFQ